MQTGNVLADGSHGGLVPLTLQSNKLFNKTSEDFTVSLPKKDFLIKRALDEMAWDVMTPESRAFRCHESPRQIQIRSASNIEDKGRDSGKIIHQGIAAC